MSFNIDECLDEIKMGKEEVNNINKKIIDMHNEYLRNISLLGQELKIKNDSLQQLKKQTVSFSLGSFIDELSWLSLISVGKINVSLEFNKIFSDLDSFFQFGGNTENFNVNSVRLRIWSNDNLYNNFDYFMFLDMDMNMICYNGKRLIECFSVSLEPFSTSEELLGKFSLNKEFIDIPLCFDLSKFEYNDGVSWYPSDLFSQAVYNCAQRNYDFKVDKIRQRIKSF